MSQAARLNEDRSTALEAYRSGRVTIRELARALGLEIWAVHDLLRAEGVEVSQGDRMETTAAFEAVLQDALHADDEHHAA